MGVSGRLLILPASRGGRLRSVKAREILTTDDH